MTKILVALATASVLSFGLFACSSGDETGDPTGSDNSELRRCVDNVMCVQGYVWSQKKCGCVPAKDAGTGGGGGGVQCGTSHCGANQYCCSSSCGICENIGAMCPAIACSTPL